MYRTLLIVVPMLQRRMYLIGVIAILSSGSPPIHRSKQIELVTTFAAQAAHRYREHPSARGRTGTHRDLSESLEQQTATSEVLGSSALRPAIWDRSSAPCSEIVTASARQSSVCFSCTRAMSFA